MADLSWMEMKGERVPEFFYDTKTAALATEKWPLRETGGHEEGHDTELRLLKFSGDVVKRALLAWCAVWLPLLCVIPFFKVPSEPFSRITEFLGFQCEHGIAAFPAKTYLWFLIPGAFGMWHEFQSFRQVLPCALRVSVFKIVGYEVGFSMFAVVYFPFSVANICDIMFKSLSLAQIIKTGFDPNCSADVAWFPFMARCAVAVWVGMVVNIPYVLSGVFPLGRVKNFTLRSLRTAGPVYFSGFDLEKWDTLISPNENAVYETWREPVQNHQGSIFYLADAARWASISCFESMYLKVFHAPRNHGCTALKAVRKSVCSFVCVATPSSAFLFLQIFFFGEHNPFVNSKLVLYLSLSLWFISILSLCCQLRITWGNIRSYVEDVHIGHKAFLKLPEEEQNKNRKIAQNNREDIDHADDNANRWLWTFKVLAFLIMIIIVFPSCVIWLVAVHDFVLTPPPA